MMYISLFQSQILRPNLESDEHVVIIMARKPGPGSGRGPKGGKGGQKKRRRRRVKLNLKSASIKEADGYVDRIGWTTSDTSNRLEEPPKPKEPEFIKHQCSGCGYVMKVPRPRREKYTIVCPHCDTQDKFGMI